PRTDALHRADHGSSLKNRRGAKTDNSPTPLKITFWLITKGKTHEPLWYSKNAAYQDIAV
ncbi:MAG: hypothetical protein E6294_19375, partial [Klebsiella sp.]|nr:hypothetical protein [Klebsiella sp.]